MPFVTAVTAQSASLSDEQSKPVNRCGGGQTHHLLITSRESAALSHPTTLKESDSKEKLENTLRAKSDKIMEGVTMHKIHMHQHI